MSGGTTSARAVPRLAWSLWALSVALTVFALLLLVLNLNHPGVHVYDYWLENTLGALLFSTVGAIVGSRRPQNPVGWLLCLYGLANAVGHFSSQYAIYALLTRSDRTPGGRGDGLGLLLDTATHHRVTGALVLAVSHRTVAWQTLAMVGVADRGFRRGGDGHLRVLLRRQCWPRPGPESVGDRGSLQDLRRESC